MAVFLVHLELPEYQGLRGPTGIDLSSETIRMWTGTIGQLFAHTLRKSRAAPSARWPRGEMVVRSGGEVLDKLVQKRRNMAVALKLLGTLLKNQGIHRDTSVTDGLASLPAAVSESALTRASTELTCESFSTAKARSSDFAATSVGDFVLVASS